jgi:hypothetical protein
MPENDLFGSKKRQKIDPKPQKEHSTADLPTKINNKGTICNKQVVSVAHRVTRNT